MLYQKTGLKSIDKYAEACVGRKGWELLPFQSNVSTLIYNRRYTGQRKQGEHCKSMETVIDIEISGQGGARFYQNGKFIGLLEP